MTANEIAKLVCDIPEEFRRRGDVSVAELFAASGYMCSDPTVHAAIEQQLRARPRLVDEWLTYSADKRTSSGWYVEDGAPALVGYYDPQIGRSREELFTDRWQACAQFIIRELESMREQTA